MAASENIVMNPTVYDQLVSRMSASSQGGEKRHKCEFCDRAFDHKGDLKKHVRRHSGEKPYRCAICRKEFSQLANLRTHVRTHTGEQPYKCEHCDKAFTQKFHRDRHMRIHTGEQPFKCSICNKSFNRRDYCNIHMRALCHNGTIIETNVKPRKYIVAGNKRKVNIANEINNTPLDLSKNVSIKPKGVSLENGSSSSNDIKESANCDTLSENAKMAEIATCLLDLSKNAKIKYSNVAESSDKTFSDSVVNANSTKEKELVSESEVESKI